MLTLFRSEIKRRSEGTPMSSGAKHTFLLFSSVLFGFVHFYDEGYSTIIASASASTSTSASAN